METVKNQCSFHNFPCFRISAINNIRKKQPESLIMLNFMKLLRSKSATKGAQVLTVSLTNTLWSADFSFFGEINQMSKHYCQEFRRRLIYFNKETDRLPSPR